jgi:1,2-diacylglycerol 3-beta-galactosyltransferase
LCSIFIASLFFQYLDQVIIVVVIINKALYGRTEQPPRTRLSSQTVTMTFSNRKLNLMWLVFLAVCVSRSKAWAATSSQQRKHKVNASFVRAAATASTSQSSPIANTGGDRGPLKVLFLSSDTGGGHRASAESLANQFQIHFPGSTYDLLDIWTMDGIKPYNTLVQSYKHLSAHPRQWQFLYHLSNSRPWELVMDWHSTLTCEKRIRKRIASYNPDVVVSVHPAMNNTPLHSLRHLAQEAGCHIPFFTVVTDLGSGHCTWFQRNVDRVYLASERLRKLAKRRGRTPDDRIVMTGLPIRNDFAVAASAMQGDRTSNIGRAAVLAMKQKLGLEESCPMVLVMGGGEGVGSLSQIVDELYTSLTKSGIDATICVVCGRNEKLKAELGSKDWTAVAQRQQRVRLASRIPLIGQRKRCREIMKKVRARGADNKVGRVNVVGLGFVTNMADYMVAADILVTKAGPGSIAEGAAVGLPIMLTSFLPGQEAGNVDYVLDNEFGAYNQDPLCIAEEVTSWLQHPEQYARLSKNSHAAGKPQAASEIVVDIGTLTHAWKSLN